jgi:nondiscriminating aspartyl-tRNA synthetase
VARSWTSELHGRVGDRVRIAGWLHHQRRLSRLTFLVVRDARGLAQVVVEEADQNERLARLLPETVLAVEGRVVANEQAPSGVELHEPAIEVLVEAVEAPPIELRRPRLKEQLPTVLDHAAVALRHPRQRAVLAVAAASLAGYRRALDAAGFVEIQTPKIVGGATESGANVFELDYFGRPAFLAQSPQLYKQMLVGVFERVYETGPAFRAEPHDTPRHLSEFVSLDAELGFVDDHRTVMAAAREAVAGMLAGVAERAASAVGVLGIALPVVPDEIPVVHFAEAQRLVEEATGEQLAGELDLAPAHERWLGEWAVREHDSEFVFVEGYPTAKRPFYTHPDPARPEFSNSFDLLFRGQELITGGQRLHRYADLVGALDARRLSREPLEGYLEAFRHGMPPHGGFAIGLERWTARLTGAENVREATLFPRDQARLSP